jgi:aryl-alcohol dehydrogenase-like predicted oxidoreductase
VVLSGAATREALRSNLAATAVPLDREALADLAALVEPSDRYWSARAQMAWT